MNIHQKSSIHLAIATSTLPKQRQTIPWVATNQHQNQAPKHKLGPWAHTSSTLKTCNNTPHIDTDSRGHLHSRAP